LKNYPIMMTQDELFSRLWRDYAAENPSAGEIHSLFRKTGNRVVNDHVAFRTFNDPRINIDKLARPFLGIGYRKAGEYFFSEKKLRAAHYELNSDPQAPLVFISELLTAEFSAELQNVVKNSVDRIPAELLNSEKLTYSGRFVESISFKTYLKLREESEYAAWLYVFGFRVNHFTVSVNHLDSFSSLKEVNSFLKANGHALNSSGGEIKGSPELLLEQSSTLADRVKINFAEGTEEIPSCYYEFARRYPDANGNLFKGFIEGSADKIFESTDFRK